MKQLTIKELAPYLPYGLMVEIQQTTYGKIIEPFVGIKHGNFFFGGRKVDVDEYSFDEFKPILRNLSSLTKEIEHNGERFVPLNKLKYIINDFDTFGSNDISDIFIGDTNRNYGTEYYFNDTIEIVQKMHEWHFDLYGLIEQGLAIDVETLEENCYK